MLTLDPSKRATASECIEHPWLKRSNGSEVAYQRCVEPSTRSADDSVDHGLQRRCHSAGISMLGAVEGNDTICWQWDNVEAALRCDPNMLKAIANPAPLIINVPLVRGVPLIDFGALEVIEKADLNPHSLVVINNDEWMSRDIHSAKKCRVTFSHESQCAALILEDARVCSLSQEDAPSQQTYFEWYRCDENSSTLSMKTATIEIKCRREIEPCLVRQWLILRVRVRMWNPSIFEERGERRLVACKIVALHTSSVIARPLNQAASEFWPQSLRNLLVTFEEGRTQFYSGTIADALRPDAALLAFHEHHGNDFMLKNAVDRRICAGPSGEQAFSEFCFNYTNGAISRNLNHAEGLIKLLNVELAQQEVDIRHYDRFFQSLKLPSLRHSSVTSHFEVEVPGVGERRPALAIGGCLELRNAAFPIDYIFVATIDAVMQHSVIVNVPLDVLCKPGENLLDMLKRNQFHVRFYVDRIPFAKMKQALLDTIIDWSMQAWPISAELKTLAWKSKSLNYLQQFAANYIVNPTVNAPFILQGPAGTGKTLVLVESVLQIVRQKLGRVLLCTPSDVGCDVLVERLSKWLSKAQMLRVCAPSRHTSLPAKVIPYARRDAHGLYMLPRDGEDGAGTDLCIYSVIVCTLICSDALINWRQDNGRVPFDYVIIDEICQATEPEARIALRFASYDQSVKIVLSGDPQQLGPIVHSRAAAIAGLKDSLLQQLLKLQEYSRSSRSKYRVNLTQNYRSDPSLLAISSALFYDNSLVSAAVIDKEFDADATFRRLLPNYGSKARPLPLIIYGIVGAQSFSPDGTLMYINVLEIDKILWTVKALLETQMIKKLDIAVMSPFRKQVLLIRESLRAVGLGDIRVDTVLDYQGQESRIVIVSTVLCRRPKSSHYDSSPYSTGLIGAPRMFNVMLTRPRSMLIIIGNPFVLQCDPSWQFVLEKAMASGTYIGPDIDSVEDIDGSCILGNVADDFDEMETAPHGDDIEWRFLQ